MPIDHVTYTLDPPCIRCAGAQTECVFYLSPTKAMKKKITCVRCTLKHRGCDFEDYPPTKVPQTHDPIPMPLNPSTPVVDYSDMRYTPHTPPSNDSPSISEAPGETLSTSALPGASSSTQANETLHSAEALRLQKDFDRLEHTMVKGLKTLTNLFLENMGRKLMDEQSSNDSLN